jgi:hypothetical protein
MKLLDGLQQMRKSHNWTALWVYGTKGYGKPHLLAALVCYLTAQEERVVYIPDLSGVCQETCCIYSSSNVVHLGRR